jgi:hypothetical protein
VISARILLTSPVPTGVTRMLSLWRARLPRVELQRRESGVVELNTRTLSVVVVEQPHVPYQASVFVAAAERSLAAANAEHFKLMAGVHKRRYQPSTVYFARLSDDAAAARAEVDVKNASESWPGAVFYDDDFAFGEAALRALYHALVFALSGEPTSLCGFFAGSGVCCPYDDAEDAHDGRSISR